MKISRPPWWSPEFTLSPGSQPITNEIGLQSAQSLVPSKVTKGQISPFLSESVKSTLDPIAEIVKNLNSPGFLQNCPGQQQPSEFPREGADQAAKNKKLALLHWSRAAVIQRGHYPSRIQHPNHFSTSCLWVAKRSTGFGESQSINMEETGTREFSILAGAQGAIRWTKKSHEVSSELENDWGWTRNPTGLSTPLIFQRWVWWSQKSF